jgi:hypothetical protein
VFSPAEESGARLPFQEEQDRPSLPKGVDPADPAPLTRSNAYTLELLKETSERSGTLVETPEWVLGWRKPATSRGGTREGREHPQLVNHE